MSDTFFRLSSQTSSNLSEIAENVFGETSDKLERVEITKQSTDWIKEKPIDKPEESQAS